MAWSWENLKKGGKRLGVWTGTWTGNSNTTTTAIKVPAELVSVAIHYDASITNNATVTIDSAAGANYDHVINTFDNSGGETDNVYEATNHELQADDAIKVACNVGANNAYCTIKVRV